MVGKHRHKPNTTSRRNCRRKDRRTLETATEKPRTIGQILLHGPANHEEETRLAEFRRKQRAFFEAFLPNSSFADRSVHAAIYQALRDLCMTRGGLYHAIQTQHRERSRDFLKKSVGEQRNCGVVVHPQEFRPHDRSRCLLPTN